MTRAAEILQALIARAPAQPPLERLTRMPYGWAIWLRALRPLPARPHAHAGEVVDLLAQRPATAPPAGEVLAIWPAFFSLFRQGWLPPPRDERPIRWTSGAGSVLLHVLFVAALAWLAYLQSLQPPPPVEAGGGGERVEVGFIGAGDPGTPRSDAAQSPSDSPAGEPAPATAAQQAAAETAQAELSTPPLPQVEVAATPTAPALPELATREVPEPAVAEAVAEQPVQVTEVEQPTIDYVLPPTTPREVAAPPVAEPQLREREVTVVQAPVFRAPQPRPVDIAVPPPRVAELRAREVDAPLPQVQVRPAAVPVPGVEPRLPGTPESRVRERELATPSPPAAAPASAPAPAAPRASTAPPAAVAGARTSSDSGQGPAASSAAPATTGGATPSAAASPAAGSGWQSPRAGDDWGQSRSGEARPGGSAGLFDGEGRVRLPGAGAGPGQGPGAAAGEGMADRGAPGGENDTWSRDRIEQSGTWLKRPPYDYEPTSFDRYWVPNESLLASWVRQGIKSVAIPIPGTSKKINCVVSLLQLGGGCGITDPDLNEQPTTARPPPDVPFKPELQEDNGSVRP